MSQVLVELYWADWCGHCIRFKPVWKELVEMANNGEIKKNNLPIDISFKDYIHTNDIPKYKNPAELRLIGKSFEQIKEDMIKMEEQNIRSYPTIKINGVDYEGPREKEKVLEAILAIATPMSMERQKMRGKQITYQKTTTTHKRKYKLKQKGGGDEDWENKYRKYKAKYIQLKKVLNM
jgi:thiol-disulfide isomerase/thioredoxin